MNEPEPLDLRAAARGPQAAASARAFQQGIKTADYLRDLVLAQPDLAARLTQHPIGYATTRIWNGFIPPARTCADAGSSNASARRTALIELCDEAITRSRGPAEAQYWQQLIA